MDAEENIENMRAAAVRVWRRDGPQGVTHASVADEAGVSKSLVRLRYGPVGELLRAAAESILAEPGRAPSGDLGFLVRCEAAAWVARNDGGVS